MKHFILALCLTLSISAHARSGKSICFGHNTAYGDAHHFIIDYDTNTLLADDNTFNFSLFKHEGKNYGITEKYINRNGTNVLLIFEIDTRKSKRITQFNATTEEITNRYLVSCNKSD